MNIDEMILEIYDKSTRDFNLNDNEEYNDLWNEYDKLLVELLSYIPEGKGVIWMKLENNILQRNTIIDKDTYTRGFKDGAKLIMGIKE
jgi:hypothetical protein